MEPLGLFQRSLGTGSDVVMKEMYRFEDLSGHPVVLRPENTAGKFALSVASPYSLFVRRDEGSVRKISHTDASKVFLQWSHVSLRASSERKITTVSSNWSGSNWFDITPC